MQLSALTDESEHSLREREHAGVEQQTDAVGAVLRGQDPQGRQQEARHGQNPQRQTLLHKNVI